MKYRHAFVHVSLSINLFNLEHDLWMQSAKYEKRFVSKALTQNHSSSLIGQDIPLRNEQNFKNNQVPQVTLFRKNQYGIWSDLSEEYSFFVEMVRLTVNIDYCWYVTPGTRTRN